MRDKDKDFRPTLILASASPRRQQLLAGAGLKFEIIESGIAELREGLEDGEAFALRMASAKATAVSRRRTDSLVLGADTVVIVDSETLGKPDTRERAREMLRLLSARTHQVITAFAIAKDGKVIDRAANSTLVTFRELSVDEIEAYVATGEPFDKAGGYAVQGNGSSFIARIDGSYTNVMGLPLREVLDALKRQHVMW